MTLPTGFQFSQGSLQDYVDCPRRFQLRYLRRLAWPALEAEPALENERYLQQGAAFHRMVHQHILGIPAERLSGVVVDEDLQRWWRSYLAQPPADLPPSRYPEIVLSAPMGGHRGESADRGDNAYRGDSLYRLTARYDLVAVDAGRRVVVIDWKTSRQRPRRGRLAGRLQTRVYPYVLVRAGAHLNGGQPLQPEQVEMVYWFANFPADPERFAYDAAQYRADEAYLASLIAEIERAVERFGGKDFPLTAQERRCNYCPYRSLCQRGVRAGALQEAEEEPGVGEEFDVQLDFEQIAEVEY